MPYSLVVRRERCAPRRFARGVGCGAAWQKKFTPNGALVPAVIAASSRRIASGASIAQGREPRPPALHTAMASALP